MLHHICMHFCLNQLSFICWVCWCHWSVRHNRCRYSDLLYLQQWTLGTTTLYILPILTINSKGQITKFTKGLLYKLGNLSISVLWTLKTDTCSSFILEILHDLLSELSYHSVNFWTRIRIIRISLICDFVAWQFHSSLLRHYKFEVNFYTEIGAHLVTHSMGWPFCFCDNPTLLHLLTLH